VTPSFLRNLRTDMLKASSSIMAPLVHRMLRRMIVRSCRDFALTCGATSSWLEASFGSRGARLVALRLDEAQGPAPSPPPLYE
jgi:hypothetical protein